MEDELFNNFDQNLYKLGVPLYKGDGTPLSDISNITPSHIGDGFSTGSTEMVTHALQSGTFLTGVRGWQIDAEGNAEFNDGTFRGTFNIGGTTITIDNTEDIQENLDTIEAAGGGTLYLQPGTYTLTADILIPSGVRLKGVSRDGVIIDCDSSYKVQMVGSDAYNTGTITIANGDDEVVGSGTTFTSDMVGKSILLGKDGDYQWYEITVFTDATHIDVGSPYTGPDLSGDTYTIATINTAAGLSTLTITNATLAGLKVQYAMEPNLDDLYIYGCGTGMDFDQVVYPLIYLSSVGNGVNWDANEMSGYEVNFSVFDDSTTGAGIVFNKVGTATFIDSSVRGNFGDGINMTNCNFNAMIAMDVTSNGGQGIELVSNCNDNQFIAVGANDNISDGYKFTATSDRNVISNCTIKDNGGYGVNIAAATCDDNIISTPAFNNNALGNINNSGTNTKITLDDSSAQTISGVKTFSADPIIPDEAYSSSWNGVLEPPTKNAVYDKIESLGSTPFHQQDLALSVNDSLTSTELTWGSMNDGSAFFVYVQGTALLYRFGRDSTTGQYYETHSINPTLGIPSGDTGAIINIGTFIYLFSNDGTNVVCSRFLAADLTGEQVMTVPTVTCAVAVGAWTDGIAAYLVSSSSQTTSRKWSVSGTTFSAVSTATVTTAIFANGAGASSMWDGTNAFFFDAANNSLKKLTNIDGSTLSATSYIQPVYSDLQVGGIVIFIDSTKMYTGFMYPGYDEAGQVSARIRLIPLTKP